MKIDDVVVGGRYLCRVSGERVAVVVEAIEDVHVNWYRSHDPARYQRRCRVKRLDNGLRLKKLRPASALEPIR